jgi:hypothetical protein
MVSSAGPLLQRGNPVTRRSVPRAPMAEARTLLNCVLRDGDILGTDATGRTALLLMIDPWTLNRLLTFDADAADDEAEPDEEIDGPATVLDFAPPKRVRRVSPPRAGRGARPALRGSASDRRARRSGARRGAAADVDRAGASSVLPDLPEGPSMR